MVKITLIQKCSLLFICCYLLLSGSQTLPDCTVTMDGIKLYPKTEGKMWIVNFKSLVRHNGFNSRVKPGKLKTLLRAKCSFIAEHWPRQLPLWTSTPSCRGYFTHSNLTQLWISSNINTPTKYKPKRNTSIFLEWSCLTLFYVSSFLPISTQHTALCLTHKCITQV